MSSPSGSSVQVSTPEPSLTDRSMARPLSEPPSTPTRLAGGCPGGARIPRPGGGAVLAGVELPSRHEYASRRRRLAERLVHAMDAMGAPARPQPALYRRRQLSGWRQRTDQRGRATSRHRLRAGHPLVWPRSGLQRGVNAGASALRHGRLRAHPAVHRMAPRRLRRWFVVWLRPAPDGSRAGGPLKPGVRPPGAIDLPGPLRARRPPTGQSAVVGAVAGAARRGPVLHLHGSAPRDGRGWCRGGGRDSRRRTPARPRPEPGRRQRLGVGRRNRSSVAGVASLGHGPGTGARNRAGAARRPSLPSEPDFTFGAGQPAADRGARPPHHR